MTREASNTDRERALALLQSVSAAQLQAESLTADLPGDQPHHGKCTSLAGLLGRMEDELLRAFTTPILTLSHARLNVLEEEGRAHRHMLTLQAEYVTAILSNDTPIADAVAMKQWASLKTWQATQPSEAA